jgi:hypothetical protein
MALNENALDTDDLTILLRLARENGSLVLAAKIETLIRKMKPGSLVFHLELAIRSTEKHKMLKGSLERAAAWAPTLNEYNALEPWAKAKLRRAIDWEIAKRKGHFHAWNVGYREIARVERGKLRTRREGGHRRIVNVRRESSVCPDELSVDVLGGKMPIDRLVAAGVLVGDTDQWLIRRGEWQSVPPGQGRVIIDVYELGDVTQ